VHVFSSLAEDIEEFAADYGGDVEFVRVAVTPEQARQYNLPSRRRKRPTGAASMATRPGSAKH
jgi:hypothetical protein